MSKTSTIVGLLAGASIGIALGVSLVQSAGAQHGANSPQTTSSQNSGKGGVATASDSGQVRAGGATSVSGLKVGTAGGSADGQAGGSARDLGKKLFLVEFSRPQTPQRNAQGQALHHDVYVAKAARAGQVLLAGPLEGGMEGVLLQFADRAAAEAFVRADPGVQDGSVQAVRLREWNVTHDSLGGQRLVTVPGPGKPPRGG